MKRIGPGHHVPERWEGLSNMKYYYACPDIPVNHDEVRRERLRYWDCEQHIYKEDRLVFLDTRKPGDKTVPPEKLELVRGRYQDWTVYPGQLKPFEPSMIEEESQAVDRKLRTQENKALKESRERVKLLEEKIASMTNAKKTASSVTAPKKRKKSSPLKAKPSKPAPRISSSAEGNSLSSAAANNKVISALQAEIAELRRQNHSQSSSRNPKSTSTSTYSKVVDEINEADQKLILEQKKRKIADEELEAAQSRTAKNKLEVEARVHEEQIQREGEVQRVKLKAQADEILEESESRRRARAEEERRRRFNSEDQDRRQQMQFAKEEHALMLQKERANITMSAASQQHEQQLQLIYASQQPNNLAMVLNRKQGTQQPNYVVRGTQQHLNTAFFGTEQAVFHQVSSSSSSKVGQKRNTRGDDDGDGGADEEVQKLRLELQKEKEIQENIRRGANEEDGDYADEEADDDEAMD